MIAHLQKGAFGSARILQESTAEQMQTTALTLLPRVHRMMLGFYEQNYNGHRAMGHGGDTNWFHSDLHLFVDDGVGMYISLNSGGVGSASHNIRSTLFDQFADRYLPGATLDGKLDEKTTAEHAHMMTGIYENSRRMDSSFFSLLGLAGPIKVIANPDNTISVSMAPESRRRADQVARGRAVRVARRGRQESARGTGERWARGALQLRRSVALHDVRAARRRRGRRAG